MDDDDRDVDDDRYDPDEDADGERSKTRKKRKKSKKGASSKSKKHRSKGGGKRKSKEDEDADDRDPHILLKTAKKNPVFSEAPLTSHSNLAGRPDSLLRSAYRVKRSYTKIAEPYLGSQNLGVESYIHFVIRANKHEWIRFRPDSLTMIMYGTMRNVGQVAGNANPVVAAERHAFRARMGQPRIWVDPSVQLSGLITKTEVSIDNVPVPTNQTLGELFLHYVRLSRVFRKKAGPVITTQRKIRMDAVDEEMPALMRAATKVFDYKQALSLTGSRGSVYLEGIFPFGCKNKTLESVENKKCENLYLPPDTCLDIKFHLSRSKIESFFHPTINSMEEYFNRNHVVNIGNQDLRMTLQSAELEYECIELNNEDEEKALKEFATGGRGTYHFDIPRAQHQSMAPNSSYTKNVFHIKPYAKLMYIAFIPDWAAYYIDGKNKPISCLSRFPLNSTNIEIQYFGQKNLLTDSFERFGMPHENHQISKRVYYQYLKQNNMTDLRFEDFFPRSFDGNEDQSLIQCFVFELSNMLSDKTEILSVNCQFAAGQTSPAEMQILVITVHPTGEAVCTNQGTTNYQWHWKFVEKN